MLLKIKESEKRSATAFMLILLTGYINTRKNEICIRLACTTSFCLRDANNSGIYISVSDRKRPPITIILSNGTEEDQELP